MGKNVFRKTGICMDAALVVLGWTAFFIGMLPNTEHPILTVCFMAVARVPP